MSGKKNVIVLGFDGLDPYYLNKFLNKLPHLRKVIQEGCFGILKSTIPPVTPGAWVGITSGTNPGKSGILGFFKFDRTAYRFKLISARDKQVKDVWDIISNNGYTCGLVNVPVTYPPKRIKHFMISGRFTPGRVAAFPKSLERSLKSAGYISFIDITNLAFICANKRLIRINIEKEITNEICVASL